MSRLFRRAPLALALSALSFFTLSTPNLAASGTAMGVRPAAELESHSGTRTLSVGADVFIGDRVVTGPDGQVQIKFSDQTELVVGPSSALVIEDYLLRDDQSAGKFAINALSGTFRFTTGRAPKDRYAISTPTGTIGVRGTSLDFTVTPSDTQALLYHGAVILCNTAEACVTLDDTCEIGQYDFGQSQVLGQADDFMGDEREDLKAKFRYAQSQGTLLPAFRVEGARECFNKGFRHIVTESLNTGHSSTGDGLPPPPDGCWYVEGELFCL